MEEHPAKRVRLDPELEQPAAAPTTTTAPAPAPTTSTVDRFSFANETGLFALVAPSLGIRASTEPEVGISEYADPDVPPFSGIIKHRFTDFLVFEVGLDGQVVRLKDIQGPQKAPPPPKEQKVVEEIKPEDAPEAPLWSDAAETVMKPLLSEEKLAEFKTFVLEGIAPRNLPKGTPQRLFQSNAIEAKDARTAFHKGLREAFDGKMTSEMKVLDGGVQVIEVAWKAPGAKKERMSKAERDARQSGNSNHPPYIHFTLQKTNKEMHDALSGLSRTLRLQPRDLGTAGTKDKRAVTVQRVSMKRGQKTLEDVWRAVKGGGGGGRGRGRGRGGGGGWSNGPDRGVRIGDLAYGDIHFDLGMLKGNRFVITLRDVQADSTTTIERAMATLRDRGFINYYGMQRFGTAAIPTHAIGLALLRSDWALAVHLIMLKRDGEAEDIAFARQLFSEGKIKQALQTIPRRAVAERAVLEWYSQQNTTDHLAALSRIPKNLRMMYVHAWQSYIWNRIVSERVKLFGCTEVIVGDLVLLDGEATGDGEVDMAEEPVAAAPVESLDPNLDDDEPTPSTATKGVLTAERAAAVSRVAKVKALTQADIDSRKYSIFDVVLPMPGFAVTYPVGALGDKYREIMKSDKIDMDDMFRKQKEYSLGGTYRKIMHLPKDVTHKLITYTSSTQDLAQSDEDVLLGKPAPEVSLFNPDEPLPEGHTLGLQLEITLGSSTYATMALREVLKARTSGAHQRSLTEAMELKEAATKPVEEEEKAEVEEQKVEEVATAAPAEEKMEIDESSKTTEAPQPVA